MKKTLFVLFSILVLLTFSFFVKAQSIERVFGNDCIGFANEFQFSCGGLPGNACTFSRWEISGNYTKQYDDGGILDLYWNSVGPVTIKAHYLSPTLGYELNVTYNLTIINSVTPTVSIAISSAPSSVCSNSSVQFTATPNHGGDSPYYNWFVNSVNRANGSSNTFTWSNWSNNDVVTVRMTSSINCLTTTIPPISNGVPITVTPPPVVELEIGGTSMCSSSSLTTIYAHATHGGSSPQYMWYRNGIGVSSSEFSGDQIGSTYSPASQLQPGDKFYCTVVSNQTCASATPVSSEVVTVYQGIPPNLVITPTKTSICSGDPLTFYLSCDYPTTSVYTITYNGTIQSLPQGVNEFTIPAFQSSSNYNISATVTVSGTCLSTTNPTSIFNASQITVSNIPAVTTSPTGEMKICSTCTQLMNLTASGNNTYQWYKDGDPIAGAIGVSYGASLEGAYTVTAKQGTCPIATSMPPLQLTKNAAPVIVTKGNLVITLPTNSITLTSTATDADGTIQSYSWGKMSGGGASLTGINSNKLSLTNLEAGTYTFRLIVTDNFGETSSADVLIKVNNAPNYVMESTIMVDGKMANDQLNLPVDQMAVSTTYFDGLGRIMQKVNKQASPGSKDIVQPVVYDEFGRESSQYLPYVDSDNTGAYKVNSTSDQTSFYNGSNSAIFNSLKPYSKTVFEPSPLSRVMKQGAFGEAWQPVDDDPYSVNDHTIKKRSAPNQASDFILILNYDNTNLTVQLPPGSNIYFDANSLLANSTYDELNNNVIEFVDKLGRTICKKVQSGGTPELPQFASTYYIYDDFGNLVLVLPPEGVEKLKTALNLN